jgi:chlorite dismutase
MDQHPILNLYAAYAYTEAYWNASVEERQAFRQLITSGAPTLGEATHFYSVFPARKDIDFLLWTAQTIADPGLSAEIFKSYAETLAEWRKYIKPVETLWGFTRPSMYSRGKSEQDINPLEGERAKFFVIYPFSKTKEWYLMSFDARQGMMNEHIKLGKQYFDVKQLLLYSFGLQDHEFVVAYEIEELPRFSELVQALRSTEGRRHTLLDTPIVTCVYQTSEEFVGA